VTVGAGHAGSVIFICVKFAIRPEKADDWLNLVDEFTRATRAEPGNIFFEWSRGVDDPNVFVLIEAFRDGTGEAHVSSDHFRKAMEWMPDAVAETPSIVSVSAEGEGWSKMAEVSPR
jgi:quinol monooxygenase YgiN